MKYFLLLLLSFPLLAQQESQRDRSSDINENDISQIEFYSVRVGLDTVFYSDILGNTKNLLKEDASLTVSFSNKLDLCYITVKGETKECFIEQEEKISKVSRETWHYIPLKLEDILSVEDYSFDSQKQKDDFIESLNNKFNLAELKVNLKYEKRQKKTSKMVPQYETKKITKEVPEYDRICNGMLYTGQVRFECSGNWETVRVGTSLETSYKKVRVADKEVVIVPADNKDIIGSYITMEKSWVGQIKNEVKMHYFPQEKSDFKIELLLTVH